MADCLDIKNLMKAEIFNKLAFRFILTKQELGFIKVLEKKRRLLIESKNSDQSGSEENSHKESKQRTTDN